jgi:hypothetical protein
MSTYPEEFSVRIDHATLIPDERALREFIAQFRQALQDDPQLSQRFETHPNEVLCERGIAADLQRELLAASGLAGAAEECVFTCLVTNISCDVVGTGAGPTSAGTIIVST